MNNAMRGHRYPRLPLQPPFASLVILIACVGAGACVDDDGIFMGSDHDDDNGANSYDGNEGLYDPVEQRWTIFSCYAEYDGWNGVDCRGGYRLPTRDEWMELLGGCTEISPPPDGEWDCNPCAQSADCSSLLGITPSTSFALREGVKWAFTRTMSEGARYKVNLKSGKILKDYSATACAFCLREGGSGSASALPR